MNTGASTLAAIGWLFGAPAVTATAIQSRPALRRWMARWYYPATAAGCTGIALVLLGPIVIGGAAGMAVMIAGAPLCGLCVWARRGGGGDDGPDGPGPDEPADGPDSIDWDQFMRDFEQWAGRHDAWSQSTRSRR